MRNSFLKKIETYFSKFTYNELKSCIIPTVIDLGFWGRSSINLSSISFEMQFCCVIKTLLLNDSFFLTKLGNRIDSAQRQYCRIDTTPRGVTFTRKGLSKLVKQHSLRPWHNRRKDPFNLTVLPATLSWALLIDTIR